LHVLSSVEVITKSPHKGGKADRNSTLEFACSKNDVKGFLYARTSLALEL